MLLNYQGSVIAALLGLALAAYFANRILSIQVTDNKVQIYSNGLESVSCSRSDGLAINGFKKLGIKVYIVSTEENIVVKERGKKLQVKTLHGIKDKLSLKLDSFNKEHNTNLHIFLAEGHTSETDPWQTIKILDKNINDLNTESDLLCNLKACLKKNLIFSTSKRPKLSLFWSCFSAPSLCSSILSPFIRSMPPKLDLKKRCKYVHFCYRWLPWTT